MLAVPGRTGIARDVNARGDIVGCGGCAAGGCALLWRADKVIDLNECIDPKCGWRLLAATAIDDSGAIACIGICEERGEAVLLVPRGPDETGAGS